MGGTLLCPLVSWAKQSQDFASSQKLNQQASVSITLGWKSMVWNMPLGPMTTHQAVSLRLNPDSALVSSLGNQYSWGQQSLDPKQVRDFMERQSANYNGDAYHLIAKNCNHFCEDTCYKLTGNQIPSMGESTSKNRFTLQLYTPRGP
ncbi:hypothetical protein OIU84_014815 [Salix udensis]|uniref:PPPDE domain-containing protein n=1 Tax=Salix udensis TaxID=889485 RepID=A0AAD6JDA8_9ROSI|nr:hypothetical protein OIU84_014815 [Salix udensis]